MTYPDVYIAPGMFQVPGRVVVGCLAFLLKTAWMGIKEQIPPGKKHTERVRSEVQGVYSCTRIVYC